MRRKHLAEPNEVLATQASQMRRDFPELYSYLRQRDASLERAQTFIALRYDVESCATQNPWMRIESIFEDLDPGIAEITK